MIEIWKDIVGYEGFYQVSNYGRVKSLERISHQGHLIKERIMSANNRSLDYTIIRLCSDGKITNKRIHQLVAEAFIPNPENKPQINHISGIRNQNFIENLEWCTQSENNYHAYKIKLRESPNKGRFGKDNFHSVPVNQYDINNSLIKEFDGMTEAQRVTGVSQSKISECVRNKRKTAGGFIWQYSSSQI